MKSALCVISLLLALTGCDSESSEEPGPTTAASAEQPGKATPAPEAAKPTPPPAAEDEPVDEAAAIMDQLTWKLVVAEGDACDCPDRACADAVRSRYAEALAAVEPLVDSMDDRQKRKHAKGKRRWLQCTMQDEKRAEEFRKLQGAACSCRKGDRDCLRRTADDVGDVNAHPRVQAWVDEDKLQTFSVESTRCLLAAGMKAKDAVKEGIPQKYVDAAKK